jgi:predicted ATPase/tRNA A-37 threonylcarbamoyl transferase component Bud32
MGEVYLAHDAQLQRPVALKILGASAKGDQELQSRLAYEARAASALNHPNILTVYDIGEADGEHFIATEFVDGVTLRQRMARVEPPLGEVLDIAVQIASALAAAEEVGLVHRDVKPDNIMIRRDGYVKLLDFGLARNGQADSPEPSSSDANVVRGTVLYMSPEQLRGRLLDSRSDIWSSGVVLYELIAGRPPFSGINSSEIVTNILHKDPESLVRASGAAVPDAVSTIARRALSRDRALRHQSAREFLYELQAAKASLSVATADGVAVDRVQRDTSTEQVTRVTSGIESATNLPTRLTPLLGRELECDEVAGLLRRDGIRLVTLTGPGGTGKTRLSLAAGEVLRRDFADGVWWVSLAAIRDPRLLAAEIAAVLDVREGGAPLHDALKSALREKEVLLILDNFEQIVDGAAVVDDLLRAAPRTKMLVTSRGPLHIAGEREYAVPPLSTPPLDLPLSPEALLQYPAVALFVERAASVAGDYPVTQENASAIAELCVRLDGLPLAIELAAARVKILPPRAMLSRIHERLHLLGGNRRDLPERQQTMRAAISWGYQLLEPQERSLFSLLAVFRGGFSLAQAERLAQSAGRQDESSRSSVLDLIASLVDKAFLRRDPASPDEEPRFVMLETIRDYGLETLGAEGGVQSAGTAHASLMADLAEERELEMAFENDADNFRSAIEQTIDSGSADVAIRLGAALWWSWYVLGDYGEGRRALESILALEGAREHPKRAKALTGAGALAFLQCDYEHAIILFEESIERARALGDQVSLATSLQFRGSIARERGNYEQAIDLHLLSRTIWAELEDRANVARSLNYVGFASWLHGDFARASELCEGTLQMFRDRRDVEGVVWSLLNLAAVALYTGNLHGAEQRLDECLSWARSGSFKEGIAWSLNLLGYLLRQRGADARAETMLQDSLRLHWALGDRWRSASVLEALGGLRRDPRLFGAANHLRETLGTPIPPVERAQVEADLAVVGKSPYDVILAVEAAL